MLRLTFLLCSGLFLVMLLGGRDFGQLRPGLAQAEALAEPVTAAVPVVETVALAADAGVAPIVVAAVVPKPVVIEALSAPVLAVAPADQVIEARSDPASAEPENTVFTLSDYADPAPVVVVPEQAAEGEIWYVSGKTLNVRAGPSTDDAVVGKLVRGEAMLMVAHAGDEWARIRIEGDGIEGYVATRFLTAELPNG